MTERIERCETCRWLECDTSVTCLDHCHRHAPPAYVCAPGEPVREAAWPVVALSDWCGEYQPTPPAAATSHAAGSVCGPGNT